MTNISKGDKIKKVRNASSRDNKYEVLRTRLDTVVLESCKTGEVSKYSKGTFIGGGGSFRKIGA